MITGEKRIDAERLIAVSRYLTSLEQKRKDEGRVAEFGKRSGRARNFWRAAPMTPNCRHVQCAFRRGGRRKNFLEGGSPQTKKREGRFH